MSPPAPAGPLRVGVIGGSVDGGWAAQSHLPALKSLPDVTIHAVATTRMESAQRSAQALGAAAAYTSAESLASDPEVDLVTVAVKIPAHADAVLAVVNAGKAVYCEWPLGTSTAEARKLTAAADAAGIRTFVGLQARLAPQVQRARQLVAEGAIGRVLSVQAFSAGMGLGGPVLPVDRVWAADAEQGLSVLSVRTAHTLDAVEFIVGPLAEVCGVVQVATPEPVIAGTDHVVRKTAPDQVVVSGRFADGASLSAQFLLGVHPPRLPLISVLGTEGTITLSAQDCDAQVQMADLILSLSTGGSPTRVDIGPAHGHPSGLAELAPEARGVARVYDAISRNTSGLPDFDDAVRLHELLDAIALSSRLGVTQPAHPGP